MSVRQIQWALASVFFVLGGWCLVSPGSVMALTIRPEHQSQEFIALFAFGCFGAQAVLAGLFAAFSKFTKTTFLAYGLALLPFFVFNYWFFVVKPVLSVVGLLDAVGNLIMLALCIVGWRKAPRV